MWHTEKEKKKQNGRAYACVWYIYSMWTCWCWNANGIGQIAWTMMAPNHIPKRYKRPATLWYLLTLISAWIRLICRCAPIKNKNMYTREHDVTCAWSTRYKLDGQSARTWDVPTHEWLSAWCSFLFFFFLYIFFLLAARISVNVNVMPLQEVGLCARLFLRFFSSEFSRRRNIQVHRHTLKTVCCRLIPFNIPYARILHGLDFLLSYYVLASFIGNIATVAEGWSQPENGQNENLY